MQKVSKIYIILAFLALLVGLYISGTAELSFDESYYWIYSKYSAWGYYDHPPMVAWSIALGTMIFGDTEFGVRFFSQLYLIGTVYLIFKMIPKSYGRQYVIGLLFSMPLISLSGLVALPDSPLMFFSTLFFYRIKQYLELDNIKNALYLAVVIAAMFYSKYHGLLIVLLTVAANISFIKRKSFWLVALTVTLLYLPHMIWQYQHDFVSFLFHLSGRVEKHFSFMNILNYIGGQFLLMGF